MRSLLIGRGHLGSFLARRLSVPSELHWMKEMAELDAATLKRLAPAAVINVAGKTDLRWCEEHPGECFRCNVEAPLGVWRAVRAAFGNSVPYLHLSSGCIWEGPYKEDGSPFGPNDPPRPACFYAWTKAACDALMLQESAGAPLSILRPRQVYSPDPSPRNTLTKLRAYPGLIDTPNSMTSAETIARAIECVLAKNSGALGRILNVYDRGVTSPYQVGQRLARAGLRAEPQRIPKSELDSWHKPKRIDAVIHDPFFEKLVNPPGIEEELDRVIEAYRKASAAPSKPI